MPSATYQPSSAAPREPLGRRAAAFLFVVAVHILLVVVLFLLAPTRSLRTDAPKIFEMSQIPAPRPASKAATRAKRPASKPAAAKAATPTPRPEPKAPPSPKLFDTELFAGVDITKLPNQRADRTASDDIEGSDAGTGKDSAAAYGPGEGPGGQTLYQAEWYTEPTRAQLAYYLPQGAPLNAWAIIACRTVEKFRVEDCRELGDSPPGSGLARAITQAAWQFRVLPPRINGRPQIGRAHV